jgi:transposase
MWCIPKVTPEFLERMYDVLDIYAKPYDPKEPVICLDEKSKELHTDARIHKPTEPGSVRKRDYEYVRHGTTNIFMTVEPRAGFRTTQVTERRTRTDFAKEIQRIVSLKRYKHADRIHIVLDNLNTHNEKSLVEAFGTEKTKRLMERIQFHHTPKHASWLNMAEIELSIMERQCTRGRVATTDELKRKLRIWNHDRNSEKKIIHWGFTKQDAKEVFKERVEN